jgi:alkanesulfonate monooxygenase SsuD/methylene tetrahydromethanopterin reductase-like flavin-dependent oxidoreductase (luciferase family)
MPGPAKGGNALVTRLGPELGEVIRLRAERAGRPVTWELRRLVLLGLEKAEAEDKRSGRRALRETQPA